MNQADEELSILQSIVGNENAIKESDNKIRVVVSSPSTTITVIFTFPAEYPSSPPSFQLIDKGTLSQPQANNLIQQIQDHFSLMSGIPTLVPLIFRIESFLHNRSSSSRFSTLSPSSIYSAKKKGKHLIRSFTEPTSISSFLNDPKAEIKNDIKFDSLLAFFFYKAVQQHKKKIETNESDDDDRDGESSTDEIDSSSFLSCLENLRNLKLIKSDASTEKYQDQLQSIMDFIETDQNIPQPIKDIILPNPNANDNKDNSQTENANNNSNSLRQARFFRLFTIEDQLGRGGYGSVIKAKYKLDNAIYAVKCVPINNNDSASDLSRECKVLSRIHHSYIVQYYFSWIDTVSDEEANQIKEKFHFDEDEQLFDTFTSLIAESADASFAWNDVAPSFSESGSISIQPKYKEKDEETDSNDEDENDDQNHKKNKDKNSNKSNTKNKSHKKQNNKNSDFDFGFDMNDEGNEEEDEGDNEDNGYIDDFDEIPYNNGSYENELIFGGGSYSNYSNEIPEFHPNSYDDLVDDDIKSSKKKKSKGKKKVKDNNDDDDVVFGFQKPNTFDDDNDVVFGKGEHHFHIDDFDDDDEH